MDFINNHITFKHQYCMVCKKVNRQNAILDLYFTIITANEKQEKSACIFLVFAKPFDTVNHKILLYKLDYYGAQEIALELFQSISHIDNEQ